MRNAYKPVKPSAPVPTTLHEMQSLYSHRFPSSDGVRVGICGGIDERDDIDARGGVDIWYEQRV